MYNYIFRKDDCPSIGPIPVGGDQLTTAWIWLAREARRHEDTPEKRLEGVFAMIEGRHEKLHFLQVSKI